MMHDEAAVGNRDPLDRNPRSARWLKLRSAFLSAVAASKGAPDAPQILDTTLEGNKNMTERFVLFPRVQGVVDGDASAVVATYTMPDGTKIRTKDICPRRGRSGVPAITLEQIFSHRVHGVDNTGNVRVWPAEQILLHLLLSGPLTPFWGGARVLELGSGMSGLAGMGVAACSNAAEVVITDGNPDAVKSLKASAQLNQGAGVFGATQVSATRLVWDSLDKDGARAELLSTCSAGFDIIIASDCLFFKEFHEDLKDTITNMLAPGGRVIMVQPQRGGTADLFMRRIANPAMNDETAETSPHGGTSSLHNSGGDALDTKASRGNTAKSTGRPVVPGLSVPHNDGDGSHTISTNPNESASTCAEATAVLESRLLERFDSSIWTMHQSYLKGNDSGSKDSGIPDAADLYVPDRHQPLLLELQWAQGGNSPGHDRGRADETEVVATAAAPVAEQPWISWLDSRPEHANILDESIYEENCTSGGSPGFDLPLDAACDRQTAQPLPRLPACSNESTSPDTAGTCPAHIIPTTANAGIAPRSPIMTEAEGVEVQSAVNVNKPFDESRSFPADESDPLRPDLRMIDVYKELAERIRTKVRERRRTEGGQGIELANRKLWVAVVGGPGSGKTTLSSHVCKLVQEEFAAVCLPMDGYHFYRRDLDAFPDPVEAYRRRGSHWTFDGRRFLREVGEARRTGQGSFPGFDHVVGDPVEDFWQVAPSCSVVIVEGNYLLLKGVDPWDEAGQLFDETWAIRCPLDVAAERVRQRHMKTGLTAEAARLRVESNDLPNAKLVAERCPWDEVDVIIDSL